MTDNIPNLPFTKEELKINIKDKYVSVRKHPIEDLFIFNYTNLAQYGNAWNNVTKTCRGLVLDDDYNIVSRPFEKIFNYTQIVPDKVIFEQAPVVTNKEDGSLIVMVNTRNGWEPATRGSFTSEQALWAKDWMKKNHPKYEQSKNITCLFEAVYPENRICVDNGDREELVLIAAINNINGADFPLGAVTWWNGPVVDQVLGFTDIDEVYHHTTSNEYQNKEGVVCTWFKYQQPSFRLKVKHPEYVRLHGIIHSFSRKKVWQTLSEGKDFLSLLTDIPDEFYDMVKDVVADFLRAFKAIEDRAHIEYGQIKHISGRKEFADAAKKKMYPPIMFKIRDAQDYDPIIWKLIKPTEEPVNLEQEPF